MDGSAGDSNALGASKVSQSRIVWRAVSGPRALSNDSVEGVSRREATVSAILASLSLGLVYFAFFGEGTRWNYLFILLLFLCVYFNVCLLTLSYIHFDVRGRIFAKLLVKQI